MLPYQGPSSNGSKTEGFRNLLSLYSELHNIGYHKMDKLFAWFLFEFQYNFDMRFRISQ